MSFRINTNVTALNALRSLNETSQQFGATVSRLATGLRINAAADDPAGLIISEVFRAQIGSLEQASRNNQDAINMAKTAEAALDEVSRLLRDARSLAIGALNTGVVSESQKQANQVQLNSIIESITRIATNTAFGTKKLLDGTAGVQAVSTDPGRYASMTFTGRFNGAAITTNSAITIQVTTAAAQAVITGTNTFATGNTTLSAGQFVVNGVAFTTTTNTTVNQLVAALNEASDRTGVVASFQNGGGIVLRTLKYGSQAQITLTDPNGVLLSAAPYHLLASGTNAVVTVSINNGSGTVNATFTGGLAGRDGLTVTDADGNVIRLTEAGNATSGAIMGGQLIAGLSRFQIGANAGETASMSLGNFSAASLNLTGLDLTTSQGASQTLQRIDAAIDFVSQQRGVIGSFQRNVLESNLRSLAVAHERLSDTESAIRNADMAYEMTQFTRLQILQASGIAALQQANASHQAVLQLLR